MVSFSASCLGAAGFLEAPHPQDSHILLHPLSPHDTVLQHGSRSTFSFTFSASLRWYIRNAGPGFLPALRRVRQDLERRSHHCICSRNTIVTIEERRSECKGLFDLFGSAVDVQYVMKREARTEYKWRHHYRIVRSCRCLHDGASESGHLPAGPISSRHPTCAVPSP